jgi:ATP-dependent HslUV protease ATP-binding subunit HslU
MERLLEEVSFSAADLGSKAETIVIDQGFVNEHLSNVASDEDLSRFIL